MEFDKTILANWILSGYRFVHYQPAVNYGVVTPLEFRTIPDDGYVIDIGDFQTWEMAYGIDEFKIITHVLS